MVGAIDRKNLKLQAEIKKVEQVKTNKEIKNMSAQADSSLRSSKLKNLPNEKKKEMLEEYEEVVKKLKELELHNKKKENFKYKFKDLKYFSTLNGHSVYSENMKTQAENDKETISAMMAYSQLGVGFEVSFEAVAKLVRPERKEEFFALCKSNPNLSYDLVGMAKVIQFYNKKEYTRAYAAMVYFGLENHLDAMERFLTVKFDANFIQRIDDFKTKISDLSVFDEQAIRDEAGTNVFSKVDAFETEFKASLTGESVSDVMINNALEDNIESKAKIYNELCMKHNGNSLGASLEIILMTSKENFDNIDQNQAKIKERLDKVTKSLETPENKENIEEVKKVITGKKKKREEDNLSRVITKQTNLARGIASKKLQELKQKETTASPEAKVEIKKEEQARQQATKLFISVDMVARKISEHYKNNNLLLSEKAELVKKILEESSIEKKKGYEEKLSEIESKISSYPAIETVIEEILSSSNLQKEEIDNLVRQEQELSERLYGNIDYTQSIDVRNSFKAFIEENKSNENALRNMYYRKQKELSEKSSSGAEKEVERLQTEIEIIKDHLDKINEVKNENVLVACSFEENNILAIMSGEKEFENDDFRLILKFASKEQFEKLIGKKLTQEQFNDFKQNGVYDDSIVVSDKSALTNLLKKKMAIIYSSIVKCTEDKDFHIIAGEFVERIQEKMSGFEQELVDLQARQKSLPPEKGQEKAEIGKRISELKAKIESLKQTQAVIRDEEKKIQAQKEKEAQEKLKSPEEKLDAELKHIESKLKTEVVKGEEHRFIDELTPEELPQRITEKVLTNIVSEVLNRAEAIIGLELTTISKDNMQRLQSDFNRSVVILDRLKGKIDEQEFELLTAKSALISTKIKELDKKVIKESPLVESEQKSENKQTESNASEGKMLGADALFEEVLNPPKEPAGRTGLMAEKEIDRNLQARQKNY